MFVPLLGEQKVPSTGSGLREVGADMGLLFQALLGTQRVRVCLCVQGRSRAQVS